MKQREKDAIASSCPLHHESPVVERISRRVRRAFSSLDSRSYLRDGERAEFRYYLSLFETELARIDRKILSGALVPVDLEGFPQVLNYPGYAARVGVFIGSFDPFQMTHLVAALRFISSEASEADVVFVIPEGSASPAKPGRTDYDFRYELLKLQIEGIFSPLVVPLDLGKGADTIGIVERLIDLHRGARLKLTHLIGSDSLPTASLLLEEDLAAWKARAASRSVELDHGIHVELRNPSDVVEPYAGQVRALGSRFALDSRVVGTPSSTDFRAAHALTIVFPTEAVLSRLELMFRYGMNREWMSRHFGRDSQGLGDFQI